MMKDPDEGENLSDSSGSSDDGEEEVHPIGAAISSFLERVYTVESAGHIFIPASAGVVKDLSKQLAEDIQHATALMESEDPEEQVLGSRRISDAVRKHTRLSLRRAPPVLERALFLSLFTYYDAFLGHVLKAIYIRRPELLASIDNEYRASEVLNFSTIDDLRDAVLDDEIETLRRKSYPKQFRLLERRFGTPLREFESWPDFVECSQRRNLFTHADGVVSDQYMTVCSAEGYALPVDLETGDQLHLGPEYFSKTCAVLTEVGLKLGQVLWRKALPDELAHADEHLHQEHYSLLEREKWNLAVTVGEFMSSLPRLSSESLRCLGIVNHAIGLRASGRIEESQDLIERQDWTAAVADFVLAQHVLMDRWDAAADVMREIGEKGKYVRESAYHNWPLFHTFRSTKEFREAYEEVYGYPFFEEQKEEAKVVEQQEEELLEEPLDYPLEGEDLIRESGVEPTENDQVEGGGT